MKDNLTFLIKLQSSELELGKIEVDPELFWAWLKSSGYKEFNYSTYADMENNFINKNGRKRELDDIKTLIKRMKEHREARLILIKAVTEILYGNLSDKEMYECFKMTETLGFCPLCGWKRGDGVKTCYYGANVGAVTHQNSDEDAKMLMSPSQRSLVESYESYRCGVMTEDTCNKVKEHLIPLVKREGVEKGYWNIFYNLFDLNKYNTPDEVAEAWIKDKRCLENYLAKGYKILKEENYKDYKKIATIFNAFPGEIITYDVRLPHTCGGYGTYLGPYHIGCTGCHEEVKLWEFGIDYDIG